MDLYDAVDWRNLLDKPSGVMGYADGPVSKWPAEAWQAFRDRPSVAITVLADDRFPVFDSEAGNAGMEAVATAVANRMQRRLWSTVYTNRDNLTPLTAALKGKGQTWREAQYWPAPGVYLHCADPTGTPHLQVPWAPVTPVATQWGWFGGYDISACYGTYPVAPAPAPAPPPRPPAPPPAPSEVNVIVPELQQGARGASVAAIQKLLGGLAVDGIFGPNTHAAVLAFQHARGLSADGIVGAHTWGSLLGRPQ